MWSQRLSERKTHKNGTPSARLLLCWRENYGNWNHSRRIPFGKLHFVRDIAATHSDGMWSCRRCIDLKIIWFSGISEMDFSSSSSSTSKHASKCNQCVYAVCGAAHWHSVKKVKFTWLVCRRWSSFYHRNFLPHCAHTHHTHLTPSINPSGGKLSPANAQTVICNESLGVYGRTDMDVHYCECEYVA